MGSKASKKEARPAKTKAKRITVSTDDADAYDPAKYPYYHEFMRIVSELKRPKPEGISDPPATVFHNNLMNCERLRLTIDQKVTGWLATIDHPTEAEVKKSLASQARYDARKEAAMRGPAPIIPGVPAVLAAGGRTYASVASIQAPVPARTRNVKAMNDLELSDI